MKYVDVVMLSNFTCLVSVTFRFSQTESLKKILRGCRDIILHSKKQFYHMDICCGLQAYIYKNVMFFHGLFPALSDDTETRNIYATIA